LSFPSAKVEIVAPGLLKQRGIEPGEAAAVAKKALAGREAQLSSALEKIQGITQFNRPSAGF